MKKLFTCIPFVCALIACAPQLQSSKRDRQSEPAAEPATSSPPPVVQQSAAPPPSDIPTVPITTVDKPPKLISGSPPSYSFEMIQNNVEGIVRALILVGKTGTVRDVSILEHLGHGTDAATRAALMKYQFEPAIKNGEAVAVWIEMSVNFRPMRR